MEALLPKLQEMAGSGLIEMHDTTMWELYSLSIINELRTRANLKKLSEFGLDILYAKAKTCLLYTSRCV